MPSPGELPQQIPTPRAKAWIQKPKGEAKFWCKPRGCVGGMVMDETDTCIIINLFKVPRLKKEFIMSKQFDLSMRKIVK